MVCLGKNSFLSFIIYCIKQFHNISKLFQPLLLAYIYMQCNVNHVTVCYRLLDLYN